MAILSFELALLFTGFLALAQGAHWLVDGGASLARRFGVSTLMVGLTVIAWGTSMPEVVVSGLAAAEGNPGLALGNVLGSNVANIGLVLGSCALILPAVLHQRLQGREIFWLLLALVSLWGTCANGTVTRLEAGLLLVVFVAYNVRLFRTASSDEAAEGGEHGSRHPWFDVVIGSIAIAGGAKLVMLGAAGDPKLGLTGLALRAGMPHTVIGLTVLALGTSLPELAAGIGSALKKHHDISVGNVVGSNVFNSLAVIGIAGLIRPFDGSAPDVAREMETALARDFPVNLGFAAALVLLPTLFAGRFGRSKGVVLGLAYATYIAVLFV